MNTVDLDILRSKVERYLDGRVQAQIIKEFFEDKEQLAKLMDFLNTQMSEDIRLKKFKTGGLLTNVKIV